MQEPCGVGADSFSNSTRRRIIWLFVGIPFLAAKIKCHDMICTYNQGSVELMSDKGFCCMPVCWIDTMPTLGAKCRESADSPHKRTCIIGDP